jgi:hypothetical protein
VDRHRRPGQDRFWQSALGWRRTFEEEDEVVLEPPEEARKIASFLTCFS